MGKFKKTKNDKKSPEFKKSAQHLRTAQRGEIKKSKLTKTGNIRISKEDAEETKKTYLNKFLKLANKKEIKSKNEFKKKMDGGQNDINDKMIGNNLKMQNR